MTSVMPISTGTRVNTSRSFQPSLHTYNGNTGQTPCSRSSMAPRSFRLDAFSSSAPSNVPSAARTSPPTSSLSTSFQSRPPIASAFTKAASPPYPSGSSSSMSNISFDSTNSSQPQVKKRTRVMTTEYQVSRLTEVLNETMFPTTAQREQLAEELDMTPRRIQVWFQNKRQSLRRRRDEDDPSPPYSGRDSFSEDFDNEPIPATKTSFSAPFSSKVSQPASTFARSPGSATLPPLDVGSQQRARTPGFASSAASSNSTTPSSTTTGSSARSLFTSYRDPETPATPAFSPFEGPSSSTFCSAPSLRRSNSYLDSGAPSPAVPRSGNGSGIGSFSMSGTGYPPARSDSPYRSHSPYRVPSPALSSGLRSSTSPSAASATSTDLNYLSLQQSMSMGRSLNRSSSHSEDGSNLRLPPARDLIREADAMMQGSSQPPARLGGRPSSFGWGR